MAGTTYEPLATNTLTSSASAVTFSSISASYTDLVLVVNGKTTGTGPSSFGFRFNGDTGSNYSLNIVYGNSGGVASTRTNNGNYTSGGQTDSSTPFNPCIFHINSYSNTATYKTVLFRSNMPDTQLTFGISTWRNTAAINSIEINHFDAGGSWASGSSFTLYGILAA